MLLLEQENTRKEKIKNVPKLDAGKEDIKEYKVEAILNSTVYAYKLKSGHLPGFYYLVTWKNYPKEENT